MDRGGVQARALEVGAGGEHEPSVGAAAAEGLDGVRCRQRVVAEPAHSVTILASAIAYAFADAKSLGGVKVTVGTDVAGVTALATSYTGGINFTAQILDLIPDN